MTRPSAVQIALEYAQDGFHVFPVKPDKTPFTPHGFKDATTDAETIATWWSERPEAAIGIATGASALVVIDLDMKDGDGVAEWREFANGVKTGSPVVVRTPSGGEHHIYGDPEGAFRNSAKALAPNVDTRATGGYIVAPGSVTAAGRYKLAKGHVLTREALQPMPKKLGRRVIEASGKKPKAKKHAVPVLGTQYDQLPAATRTRVDAYLTRALGQILGRLENLSQLAKPGKTGYDGPPWDATIFEVATDLHELANSPWTGVTEPELHERFDALAPVDEKPDQDGRSWSASDNAAKWESGRRKAAGQSRPMPDFQTPDELEVLDEYTSDGADLLQRVSNFLGRFVSYPSEHAQAAHTAWIAHTHLIEHLDFSPRLAFLSPEPGSGKTRALELTTHLVPRPIHTTNASSAYIVRKISDSAGLPVILQDEMDAIFGRLKDTGTEELRATYNAGYKRGAVVGRAAIRGKEVVTEEFPCFCAVAFAGLGDMPDTIMTRSVIVRMKKRMKDEPVESFRSRLHIPEAEALAAELAAWARTHGPKLDGLEEADYPTLPDGIEDRSHEVWEPLVMVGDLAGGAWPSRLREAATALVLEANSRPATLGIRLLADVRTILGGRDKLAAVELLGKLHAIEDGPWEHLNGQPIDGRFVAKTLGKYGIPSARTVRDGGNVFRGWDRRDFHEAFERYLPDFTPSHPLELLDPEKPTTTTRKATS